jgi:DnaJ-class molecular chaperone
MPMLFSSISIFIFLSIFPLLICIDIETSSGWTTQLTTIPKDDESSFLFSTIQKYYWSTSMQNNINMNVSLTLFEVINGKKIPLNSEMLYNLCPLEICAHCSGVGTVHMHHETDEINSLNEKLHSSHKSFTPCPVCGGSGKMLKRSTCNIPSDLTVDLLVPVGAKPGEKFTYEPFQNDMEKVRSYGSISLTISGMEMPVGSAVYYDEKNTSYRMPVNITAIMAVEGFVSSHLLDVECLPLMINRSEKVTFFNSTIKVPFAFVQEYYCKQLRQQQQGNPGTTASQHIIYPKEYKVTSPTVSSLLVDFHIITMEERERTFLVSWNCTMGKQHQQHSTKTVAIVEASSTTMQEYESTYEADGEMNEEEEEIVCEDPEHVTANFLQERESAFEQFQQESLLYRRYWNWLQYLAEITQ